MIYMAHLVLIWAVMVVVGSGVHAVVSWRGVHSLGHAALVGVGAYVYALVANQGLVGLAMLLAPAAGLVLGAGLSVVARLPREEGALVTLALGVLMAEFIENMDSITGGPYGLRLTSGSLPSSALVQAVLGASVVAVVVVAGWALERSQAGTLLRAAREDPRLASSLGLRVKRFELAAWGLSGALAAAAGALLAATLGFLEPTLFTLETSVMYLALVLIGGSGRIWGPVLGATVFVLAPELLHLLDLPVAQAAHLRSLGFGLLLLVLTFFKPEGLLGLRRVPS